MQVGQPSRLTNVFINDYVHTKDQPLEKGLDIKKQVLFLIIKKINNI